MRKVKRVKNHKGFVVLDAVHADELSKLRAELAEERNKCGMIRVCHWTEDEESNWFGKCGIEWCFNERPFSPSEHGMRYCPKCGSEIIQHDYEK